MSFLCLPYMIPSCEELTQWKRLWCWEGLGARGEGDGRGWDGWMASLTRWTWVWVNSGSWWWTRRPGVLQFMGSQRVGRDWATDLIWSDLIIFANDYCLCPSKGHTVISITLILESGLQNASYSEIWTSKLPSIHLLIYNEIIRKALKIRNVINSLLW